MRSSCRPRLLPRALALVAALGLARAHAQTAAGPEAEAAQRAFDEGMRLVDEGRYREGCAKLEESQRIQAGMATQFRLAECYEKDGRTASAWRNFVSVAASANAAGMSDRARFAQERADALAPTLSRIAVQVPAEVARLAGLVVKHNGAPVDPSLWGGFPVDRGGHQVAVEATGKLAWRVELEAAAAGQTRTVKVPVLEDAPDTPAPIAAPIAAPLPTRAPPPDAPEPGGWNGQAIAGVVIAAAGVAAMGIGVGMGFAAKGDYDDSEPFCQADVCTDEGIGIRDDARALGTAATVVFVLGAAATVGGGLLWLLAPSAPMAEAEASAPWRLHLAPRAGGGVVAAGGSF